ncbi:MAG: DUF6569 family protein [Bacteroidota bacterium]
MIRTLLTFVFSLFLSQTLFSQFTYDHLVVDYDAAITYKNLRLVPIRANYTFFEDATTHSQTNPNTQNPNASNPGNWEQSNPNQGGWDQRTPNQSNPNDLLSLQDALESGQLTIRDRSGVNQLSIDNNSDRPVMLLSGEILRGGKQDRVIGQDMVIPPNSRRNRVPVYCVEEKRWSAPKQWTYYHQGSMHLRRVVDQSQNQGQVWNEIEYELKRDNVQTKSKAYTAHSKNPQYASLEQEYIDAFVINNFSYPSNIIGVIGMSGSVVIGCDLFATTELFQREYDSLIFSYVDEAITYGLPVDITLSAAKQYADKLLSNERMQQAFIQQYGKMFIHDGKIIHITTFNDRETLRDFEGLRNRSRM